MLKWQRRLIRIIFLVPLDLIDAESTVIHFSIVLTQLLLRIVSSLESTAQDRIVTRIYRAKSICYFTMIPPTITTRFSQFSHDGDVSVLSTDRKPIAVYRIAR